MSNRSQRIQAVVENRSPACVEQGDSAFVLPLMPDESVDSLVTDPPAGISFMDREWDSNKGGRDAWIAWLASILRECLRVMKPGAHGLVWALPKTSHWTATACEDAGFEIVDKVAHVFGQGFPKSVDIAKAIDKRRDDRADVLRVTAGIRAAAKAARVTNAQMDAPFGKHGMAGHWTTMKAQPLVPKPEQWATLRAMLAPHVPEWLDQEVERLNERKGTHGEAWHSREVTGEHKEAAAGTRWRARYDGGDGEVRTKERRDRPTEKSAKWAGWGTALKPGQEEWIVIRKPIPWGTTAAQNVEERGTGAFNVDATKTARGTWPTNLVFTHAPECREGFPCVEHCPVEELNRQQEGAADFFPAFYYVAKTNNADREDGARLLKTRDLVKREGRANQHPTVKPRKLMRWFVRLVTPPGGLVLDPFTGSGSTGIAAILEGARFVGVEQDSEFARTAFARVAATVAARAKSAAGVHDPG